MSYYLFMSAIYIVLYRKYYKLCLFHCLYFYIYISKGLRNDLLQKNYLDHKGLEREILGKMLWFYYVIFCVNISYSTISSKSNGLNPSVKLKVTYIVINELIAYS